MNAIINEQSDTLKVKCVEKGYPTYKPFKEDLVMNVQLKYEDGALILTGTRIKYYRFEQDMYIHMITDLRQIPDWCYSLPEGYLTVRDKRNRTPHRYMKGEKWYLVSKSEIRIITTNFNVIEDPKIEL